MTLHRFHLTFSSFQVASVMRCNEVFHPVDEWTPSEWACSLAGEVGEVCNAVKKLKRGDGTVQEIADELADVLAYAALLAERLDIDLAEATITKFNQVSREYGSNEFLPLVHEKP